MTPQSHLSDSSADALVDEILARNEASPDPALRHPSVLRLVRRLPALRTAVAPSLDSPLEHALAGLGDAPDVLPQDDLSHAIFSAVATLDAGGEVAPAVARELEARAEGDPVWWVPAARVHLLCSGEREREARAALSVQELPYALPGELTPLAVHVLAGGDRVLTALHVDWLRKITRWVGDAILADARALGFWFWPHLRYLSGGQLKKPLARHLKVRRAPVGGRGMVLAYRARVGLSVHKELAALAPAEQAVAAVAIASDRPDATV